MKISAIIKAIRARINYVPNRTNFLTSFISKGGSPLTGEDIICSYIDALNELKKRAPHVRRYCFLRAMYFEKSEIDLINLDERSLAQFIKNLNVSDSDLSIKYKKRWSKEKNIKKVLRKVVSKHVVVDRGINNNFNSKVVGGGVIVYSGIINKYDNDIKKICAVFRKRYDRIDWDDYYSEAMTKLIGLHNSVPLKLDNRKYIMVAIRNHLLNFVRKEYKFYNKNVSFDKILEELIDSEY